jgi:hypothetical protein
MVHRPKIKAYLLDLGEKIVGALRRRMSKASSATLLPPSLRKVCV